MFRWPLIAYVHRALRRLRPQRPTPPDQAVGSNPYDSAEVKDAVKVLHEWLADSVQSSLPAFEEQYVASPGCKAAQELVDSADSAHRSGDGLGACHILIKACKLEESAFWEATRSMREDERDWLVQQMGRTLSALLALLGKQKTSDSTLAAAALDCVLRRKALTQDMMRLSIRAARRSDDHDVQELFRRLRAQRALLAADTMDCIRRAETAFFSTKRLSLLKRRREDLEAALTARIPVDEVADVLRQVSTSAVIQALPTGTAFVEYVEIAQEHLPIEASFSEEPPHLIAFVLKHASTETISFVDLGPAVEISEMALQWLMVLTSPRPAVINESMRTLGISLRERLLDPITNVVPDCRRLLIAPDGAVAMVPFETLPLGTDRYVFDEIQLSYLTSGRDILQWGETVADAGPDVVIGGPDFDLGLSTEERGKHVAYAVESQKWYRPVPLPLALDFTQLPGAEREVNLVGAALGTKPLVGELALKGQLKEVCQSPRVLHIATHGFFLRTTDPTLATWWAFPSLRRPQPATIPDFEETWSKGPLTCEVPGLDDPLIRSGFALAGARTWLRLGEPPGPAEEGLFTAQEVLNLDLQGTALVFLSACETAQGDVLIGEGVFGLRRAFAIAGVQTVIASCWPVGDDVTEMLTINFYKELLSGRGRSESLQLARAIVRKRYPDPCDWGGFICIGDPAPLAKSTRDDSDLSQDSAF